MSGRTRKSDVKTRLGRKQGINTKTTKTGRILDARDVLKKKVQLKPKLGIQRASKANKDRIQRLMPLEQLLSGTKKKSGTRNKLRTLTLSSGSLQVTTKQPELCRQTVVSKNSLRVVTPSKTISSEASTTRTLSNDLYKQTSHHKTSDTMLSSPTRNEHKPMLRSQALIAQETAAAAAKLTNSKLTKIIVTNLHPRVVQEDISELFGAVGPLTSVKLEQCVAEVVFVKATHAEMAYQKYHNRMLDGQAMKCTLGLADSNTETPTKNESKLNYTGADLVYPKPSSRPVVFQVRI